MGLNFASLGVSVAAKDMGAAKTASSIGSAFDGMGAALGGVGTAAIGAATGIGSLIGGSLVGGLMKVGAAIADLGSAGRQLTTSFEAQSQAHAAAAGTIIANTGKTGAEFRKLAGTAAGLSMGLGISEEATGKAAVAMADLKPQMEALGITTVATGAKLSHLYGGDLVKTGQAMKAFQQTTKLSQKDMTLLGDEFAATGRATKDMSAIMSKMPEILELGNRRAVLFKSNLSKIGGKDAVKGVLQASRYLTALGVDATKATAAAMAMEKASADAGDQFGAMMAGMESDLHKLPTELSVFTGDITHAFSLAGKDAGGFVKEMATIFSKLPEHVKKNEGVLNFFKQRVGKQLGEGGEAIVQALSNADAATLKTMMSMDKLGSSLGKMAKESFISSKTMQDAWDMMEGAAVSRFRNIGRASATELLHNTKKAFDEFNSTVEGMVKEGGPLGAVAKKMSEVANIGAVAFLPENLRGYTAVFSTMYKSISPSLGAVTNLTGALSGLANPITILTGLIGGFALLVYKNKTSLNSWGDAIIGAQSDVKALLDTWSQKVLKWADTFDWTKVFGMLASGMADAMKGMTDAFSSMFGDDPSGIGGMMAGVGKKVEEMAGNRKTFGGVGRKILDALKTSFSKFNWGQLADSLFESLRSVKLRATKAFGDFVTDVIGGIPDDTWKSLGQTVAKGMGILIKEAFENIKSSAETQKVFRDIFIELAKIGALAYWGAFTGFWGTVFDAAKKGLIDIPLKALSDGMEELKKPLLAFNQWMDDTVYKPIVAWWRDHFGNSIIPEMVEAGFQEIRTTIETFVSFVEDAASNRLVGAFSKAVGAVRGLFGGGKSPSEAIEADMTSTLQTIHVAVDQMRDYINKVLFESVTEGISKAFVAAFKSVMDGSKGFIKIESQEFHKFADGVIDEFRKMWISVLNETDMAANAMSQTIGGSLRDLEQMKLALQEVRSAKEAIAEQKKIENRESAGKTTDPMLNAIDDPTWWHDYRKLFEQQTNAIVNAVKSGSPTRSGSGASSAADVAADLRRRTTVRGSGGATPGAQIPPQGGSKPAVIPPPSKR